MVSQMAERTGLFRGIWRRKHEVILPDIILDPLAHEHNRSMSGVANRLHRSDEYAVAGREDLAWFIENPDEAIDTYGELRFYERIVFFGSPIVGGTMGYETLRFNLQERSGKGAYEKGSPIPLSFVWNMTLGFAALHPKRKN